ncbi:MAG: 30S ribosomal protein S6 [Dehalococcoidia bacterium]|jgi:small subunit ribosomal protein S6|nr:30S ribosomal protein S6 [Dehalococcoidia bacterium]MDW8009807.1 30S ribosomal protein S6 [Chloroflexota bacterium]HXG42663.1 30S ribosomal protein S6 [Dehalococcoidia bacterium]
MRSYELMMVISPELAEEEVSATVERVQRFISERGGEVTKLDHWGRRRLAYPIKRFTEGHYVLAQFRLDGSAVRELNRSLEVSEPVLRHLVVRTDEDEEE